MNMPGESMHKQYLAGLSLNVVMYFGYIIIITGLLSANLQADDSSGRFHSQADRLHRIIYDRFIETGTGMIRTRLAGGDPLEDCSLYGGFYLASLTDAYAVTGDKSLKDEAGLIFGGLVKNAMVSGIPGFLARGIYNDGTYRGDPSVDQYTAVIYGFWRYYRSPLADNNEKETIRSIVSDMLKRLEAHNWRITRENGDMTTFGRLHSESPTRAERLLSFLLAGYDITGDMHWLEIYREKLSALLPYCAGFEGLGSWVCIQSQVSMSMLATLETDPETRNVYLGGLGELAEVSAPQIAAYSRVPLKDAGDTALAAYYDESPVFTETIRIPIEAVTVMLLSEDSGYRNDALQALTALNEHYDLYRLTMNVAVVPFEWNQWLAMQALASNR